MITLSQAAAFEEFISPKIKHMPLHHGSAVEALVLVTFR